MIFNKPILTVVNSVYTLLNVSQSLVLGLVGVVILPCVGVVVYTAFFVLSESAEYFACAAMASRHQLCAGAARSPAPEPARCVSAQSGDLEDDALLTGVDRLDDLEEALKALGVDVAKKEEEKAESEWVPLKSDLKERLRRLEETM